jgi:hypothetical protein
VLGRLSHEVGWKYQDVVATLEAKRKAKGLAYYNAKKATLVRLSHDCSLSLAVIVQRALGLSFDGFLNQLWFSLCEILPFNLSSSAEAARAGCQEHHGEDGKDQCRVERQGLLRGEVENLVHIKYIGR